jgi:hypothetical protein
MIRAILIREGCAVHTGVRFSEGVDPLREGTILPAPEPIGALDLVIASLVLGVTRLEGDEADKRQFYPKVARTVVDIFIHGMAAEASVP